MTILVQQRKMTRFGWFIHKCELWVLQRKRFGWFLGVNIGYSREKMLRFGWFLGVNNRYSRVKMARGLF